MYLVDDTDLNQINNHPTTNTNNVWIKNHNLRNEQTIPLSEQSQSYFNAEPPKSDFARSLWHNNEPKIKKESKSSMTYAPSMMNSGVQSEQPRIQNNSSQTNSVNQKNIGSMTEGVTNPTFYSMNNSHTQSRFHPLQYQPSNSITNHSTNTSMQQPMQVDEQNTIPYHAPGAISHNTLPALPPSQMDNNTQDSIKYQTPNAISHNTLPALPPPQMHNNTQDSIQYKPTRAISRPERSCILGYQSTATGRCYTKPLSIVSSSSVVPRSQRHAADEERYFCTICDEEFKSEKTLRRHHKNIHDAIYQKDRGVKRSKVLSCEHCYTDFQSERALIRHLKNIHGVFKFSSDEPSEENKRVKRGEYQLYPNANC